MKCQIRFCWMHQSLRTWSDIIHSSVCSAAPLLFKLHCSSTWNLNSVRRTPSEGNLYVVRETVATGMKAKYNSVFQLYLSIGGFVVGTYPQRLIGRIDVQRANLLCNYKEVVKWESHSCHRKELSQDCFMLFWVDKLERLLLVPTRVVAFMGYEDFGLSTRTHCVF